MSTQKTGSSSLKRKNQQRRRDRSSSAGTIAESHSLQRQRNIRRIKAQYVNDVNNANQDIPPNILDTYYTAVLNENSRNLDALDRTEILRQVRVKADRFRQAERQMLNPLLDNNNQVLRNESRNLIRNVLKDYLANNPDKINDTSAAGIKKVRIEIQNRFKLFRQTASILTNGILTPSDLQALGISSTPSSDVHFNTSDSVSFFDINVNRGNANIDPGFASVGVAVERRNDMQKHINTLKKYARLGRASAIRDIQQFLDDLRNSTSPLPPPVTSLLQKLPTNVDQNTSDRTVDALNNSLIGGLFRAHLANTPAVRGQLEGRAGRSVMFVSQGPTLNLSTHGGLQALGGSGIQELRTNQSMPAGDITDVILPNSMRVFNNAILNVNPNVNLTFVGNRRGTVPYFDAASGTRANIPMNVPDFQGAIDNFIATGNGRLITHISNIN
ncbi:hypothetical protein [Xanthovirga aplysinae]|uniref:hypothetical protein n=1 Tax=Xanthovirga aplysinae TaxID=2529853 RepID=UPI0012BC7C00|nr:hypothetical protein [Xanthovirga aplysinae]MTI30585.1 hypothetical protein [Xanthovirga aplysinae]